METFKTVILRAVVTGVGVVLAGGPRHRLVMVGLTGRSGRFDAVRAVDLRP
ncbi:hypothetical protein [Micromonospora sp. NBC_01412]|uniref:hypothetical protein n=1 Tax=Micromonospora sp. NBC_01412 TaxID=2903590 RepID=UPI0032522EB3